MQKTAECIKSKEKIMDKSFQCECGKTAFWYFNEEDKIRCTHCYTEYRLNLSRKRKFNKEENRYEDWE